MFMDNIKSKFKAFFIHLTLSALIIGLFLYASQKIFYPGPLFRIEGVWQGLKILIPVDAILGPMLTFFLFVPGKKGMKMDLSIIACIQILALIYGGYCIYTMRPAAFVFVGDRFQIVSAKLYQQLDVPLNRFSTNEQTHPLMIYAKPPSKKRLLDFIVKGIQYEYQAERYYPLVKFKDVVLNKQYLLNQHKAQSPQQQKIIDEYLAKNKSQLSKTATFIIQGTTYDSALLVLDKNTLKLKGYIDINPWRQLEEAKQKEIKDK